MKIIDLNEEHKELFCICLEDWSDEALASGNKRREWVDRMEERGLRAKLAVDDAGTVGGMIQYIPIEHSFVDGEGLYFVPCIWVHSYKQGRGDHRKQGMGKALLAAAEQDARSLGATGMAAWGVWLPFWMKASWFKKQGYRKADRQQIALLLWKPFSDAALPPRWYARGREKIEQVPGKVTVTAYVNGWCMAKNLVYERSKRAAEELGDRVVFREIDTSGRATVARCGYCDEVFVDGKTVQKGPPPSYEKIKAIIEKRLRKLASRA